MSDHSELLISYDIFKINFSKLNQYFGELTDSFFKFIQAVSSDDESTQKFQSTDLNEYVEENPVNAGEELEHHSVHRIYELTAVRLEQKANLELNSISSTHSHNFEINTSQLNESPDIQNSYPMSVVGKGNVSTHIEHSLLPKAIIEDVPSSLPSHDEVILRDDVVVHDVPPSIPARDDVVVHDVPPSIPARDDVVVHDVPPSIPARDDEVVHDVPPLIPARDDEVVHDVPPSVPERDDIVDLAKRQELAENGAQIILMRGLEPVEIIDHHIVPDGKPQGRPVGLFDELFKKQQAVMAAVELRAARGEESPILNRKKIMEPAVDGNKDLQKLLVGAFNNIQVNKEKSVSDQDLEHDNSWDKEEEHERALAKLQSLVSEKVFEKIQTIDSATIAHQLTVEKKADIYQVVELYKQHVLKECHLSEKHQHPEQEQQVHQYMSDVALKAKDAITQQIITHCSKKYTEFLKLELNAFLNHKFKEDFKYESHDIAQSIDEIVQSEAFTGKLRQMLNDEFTNALKMQVECIEGKSDVFSHHQFEQLTPMIREDIANIKKIVAQPESDEKSVKPNVHDEVQDLLVKVLEARRNAIGDDDSQDDDEWENEEVSPFGFQAIKDMLGGIFSPPKAKPLSDSEQEKVNKLLEATLPKARLDEANAVHSKNSEDGDGLSKPSSKEVVNFDDVISMAGSIQGLGETSQVANDGGHVSNMSLAMNILQQPIHEEIVQQVHFLE